MRWMVGRRGRRGRREAGRQGGREGGGREEAPPTISYDDECPHEDMTSS